MDLEGGVLPDILGIGIRKALGGLYGKYVRGGYVTDTADYWFCANEQFFVAVGIWIVSLPSV